MSKLAEIARIVDSSKRIEAYRQYCRGLLSSKNIRGLVDFAKYTIDSTDTVASRPSLEYFASNLKAAFGEAGEAEFVSTVQEVLETLGERSSSFVEGANTLRESLSLTIEEQGNFSEAARILSQVKLETKSVEDRVKILVHIAQLFLADDESEFAATYANKASQLVGNCQDLTTIIRYRLAQAKINDCRRKFLESSRQYYQISLQAREDDVQDMLRSAVIAVILAPAGPQRSRMLSLLFKDERTHLTEVFPAMEKMYLGRIVRAEEERQIEQHLLPHQKAETADGFTVLKKAVIEHNLEAASKIYNNVSFEELGTLLGVETEKAERISAKMIAEDRLAGYLDQVEGIIHFEEEGQAMRGWDEQIEQICLDVDNIVASIGHKYPKVVAGTAM